MGITPYNIASNTIHTYLHYCGGISKFYTNLMISEAGHYTTFLQFARQYQDREIVDKKWNALLAFEAEMMKERGTTAKIHG